jgi:hypothetical protein
MKHFLLALVLAFHLFLPFGTSEKINEIQDLKGTDYKLCHKYTFHLFLAGVYLTDDGYVLQKKGDLLHYVPLDKEKTDELQKSGVLPKPLPDYSIPISAYLIGYSLWLITLLIIIGALLWSWFWRRYSGGSTEYCKNCQTEITWNDRKLGECQVCHNPVKPISDPSRSIT